MLSVISSQTPAKEEGGYGYSYYSPTAVLKMAEGDERFDPADPKQIETLTKLYFRDIPVLAEIAECESNFRHMEGGRVLRGAVNRGDVGVMQVNEHYHLEDAKELGYDIYSIGGNLSYARHLYEKYGTKPWSSSAKCWNPQPIARK